MNDLQQLGRLDQLELLCPAQIRREAESLRQRSRQCAALASDCLTSEGRQVLEGRAVELSGEAEELENALLTIRRIYAESFDDSLHS